VWIHDYQLQLGAEHVAPTSSRRAIGFFLHIRFHPAELFMQLPWRKEILRDFWVRPSWLSVPSGVEFFAHCEAPVGSEGYDSMLEYDGRLIGVGAFPITIDTAQIRNMTADAKIRERAREIRRDLGNPEVVLLGVDRLDYTKGIQQRIRAITELYADGTMSGDKHVMVQVAVPSREADAHYELERHSLEQVVSEMNGDHSRSVAPSSLPPTRHAV